LLRELPRYIDTPGRRASFLDTLGRCYCSVGDYEKAIESQRAAVKLIPHMQVMQRQLKFFESQYAKKKKAGNAGQPPEKSS
jgi:hypothetical protein